MSEKEIQNVEIETLSDEELDSVAGGAAEASESCCCTTGGSNCSNGDLEVEQV